MGRAIRIVAISASMVTVGTAIAFVGAAPSGLVAVASIAAIPLILAATVRAPEIVVATIAFAQILEGFELQTPLGTISLGIISLIAFLGLRFPEVLSTLKSPGYRIGIVCLSLYVAGQGVQLLHGDPAVAIRQVITACSFAAFTVLGMYIGGRRSHLAAVAFGAAAGLLVLGALALAANLGFVPVAAAPPPGREILGVVSPFFRSYGLAGATVGLLLPLCVPWLALKTRSTGGIWTRGGSGAALVLILIASLLLFQSRSMVLEVGLGVFLVWSLANRRFSSGLMLVAISVGTFLVAGFALSSSTDAVSNQLRSEGYATAVEYLLGNPFVLIVGTNAEQFRLMVNASLTFSALIPVDAPTHNLIIETVVSGGLASGIALVVLVFAPVLSIFRSARRIGRFSPWMALGLSAVAIAVLEVMVTPAIANSAPFWTAIGCAIALSASASRLPGLRGGQVGSRFTASIGGQSGEFES
jgi:hypothetical protein